LSKNSQLKVSKALETSILRAKFPIKHLLSNTFIASEGSAVQSLIFLPLMNLLCSLDIKFGRIETIYQLEPL